MELNRRNFIKFLVGGVVGTTLSPLPWKLTDDIAIWTQNWPWVPVPPEGEFAVVKSVCSLCPGGCGIEIRKVFERAVKIEGRTDYPINPGGICPLGAGGLQLLYNESIRHTAPMKRTGERGSGQFSKITWDEAIDILSARISDLQKKGTAEAIAALDGNPVRSTMAVMIQRLLTSLGSPNYMRMPSIEDTYSMGTMLMQGTDCPMAYDLENADYVLSFGCGLLEGWGVPGRIMNAWGLWHENSGRKRAKIVQVETRASNTASKADKWIAPRPGTDAALALGIAHIMIKEGLYDREFIRRHSFGFEDWISADGKARKGFKTIILEKYSPAETARITGLDPNYIAYVAKDFAESKAPVAIYGKGKDSMNGSLYEFMAVQCLNALAGNFNRPGGVIVSDPLPLNRFSELKMDNIAGASLKKPRFDLAGTVNYPFSHSLIHNLTQRIL
ncbi:MAG: molybdopterin-dependent oxidoreductase, partial [Deltaproteobacteria bacterium]|nr:molybdopterin-dependent oxidoreductase [Deltaproteobacteria bacterium]